MMKHAASPAIRRRNQPLILAVPLVALALWSWGIAAAQAAEPGKDAPAASLPRILVLATGGTIAGQADARATGAYKSGQITGEQLMQSVPGLDKLAKLNAEQISSIGFQDMNDKVWFALARRIQDAFDKNEADGVIITYGTDTLEETAFFLDNVVRGDNVEVDDDKNGFVVSEDLNPQKARVLTQLLIASGLTAPAELQRAFTATW